MKHWLDRRRSCCRCSPARVLLLSTRARPRLAARACRSPPSLALAGRRDRAVRGRPTTGRCGVYLLGNWPPPFGIVLVLDRLAALMLLLTAVLALREPALRRCAATTGAAAHFHALFQFQLMGLNGAFLTGDLFNLFVFFEVLLIASYGLLLHGAGGRAAAAPGCTTSCSTSSARAVPARGQPALRRGRAR